MLTGRPTSVISNPFSSFMQKEDVVDQLDRQSFAYSRPKSVEYSSDHQAGEAVCARCSNESSQKLSFISSGLSSPRKSYSRKVETVTSQVFYQFSGIEAQVEVSLQGSAVVRLKDPQSYLPNPKARFGYEMRPDAVEGVTPNSWE